LASDQQSCTQKYESFIAANRETAEKLLHGIQREKKRAHSNDPRVVEQRERMKKAYHTYQEHTDEAYRNKVFFTIITIVPYNGSVSTFVTGHSVRFVSVHFVTVKSAD